MAPPPPTSDDKKHVDTHAQAVELSISSYIANKIDRHDLTKNVDVSFYILIYIGYIKIQLYYRVK